MLVRGEVRNGSAGGSASVGECCRGARVVLRSVFHAKIARERDHPAQTCALRAQNEGGCPGGMAAGIFPGSADGRFHLDTFAEHRPVHMVCAYSGTLLDPLAGRSKKHHAQSAHREAGKVRKSVGTQSLQKNVCCPVARGYAADKLHRIEGHERQD